jgi:hypothetical protein
MCGKRPQVTTGLRSIWLWDSEAVPNLAEPCAAADALQRPLRSRFQARLSRSVRRTVKGPGRYASGKKARLSHALRQRSHHVSRRHEAWPNPYDSMTVRRMSSP